MMLAGKWISDLELDAVRNMLDRPIEAAGLTVPEMNAMARLSKKGLVSFSAMRGGTYRLTVTAMTALVERAIRMGTVSPEAVRL